MHAPLDTTDSDTIAVPDGYELVDGELVERQMGAKSSWVGGRLIIRLGNFCETTAVGWVWPCDLVYRCFANPKTARKPDVSFIRLGRLPNEELPSGDLKIAPDLAVEVVSPNDTVYELDTKIEEYLAAGVRLVWVINPESRVAIVHRLDGSMAKVRENQELSGEDVVPGFRCLLSSCLPPLSAAPSSGQSNGAAEAEVHD
jgi:Uma2 family endonuclease